MARGYRVQAALSPQGGSAGDVSSANISMAHQRATTALGQIGGLVETLSSSMFDERQAHLEAATDLAESAADLLADLKETKGADARQVLATFGTIQSAILDNVGRLGIEQSAMNNAHLQRAEKQFLATNRDPAAYWTALAGSISEVGLLDNNYPGLAQIVERGLEQRGSTDSLFDAKSLKDVDAIVDRLNIASETARAETKNLFRRAWSNAQTTADSLRMIDRVRDMPDFSKVDPESLSESDIQQAKAMLEDALTSATTMYSSYAADAAGDLESLYKKNTQLKKMWDQVDKADQFIAMAGKPAEQPNTRLASIISRPEFRQWAADYGFEIGNAEFRAMDDFTYMPGRDDIRAVWAFVRQIRHPRLPVKLLMPTRYTKRYIEATFAPAAYKDAEGNYYRDAEGNYLSREEVEGMVPEAPVQYATDSEGYGYFKVGDQVFAVGENGLVSSEAPDDLEWEGAYALGTDGRPTPLTADDISEGATPDFASLSVGVTAADVLPEGYEITADAPEPEVIRGQEMRRLAGDTSLSGAPARVGADDVLIGTKEGFRRVDITDPRVTLRIVDPEEARRQRRELRKGARGQRRAERAFGVEPEADATPRTPADRIRGALSRLRPKAKAPAAPAAPPSPAPVPGWAESSARIQDGLEAAARLLQNPSTQAQGLAGIDRVIEAARSASGTVDPSVVEALSEVEQAVKAAKGQPITPESPVFDALFNAHEAASGLRPEYRGAPQPARLRSTPPAAPAVPVAPAPPPAAPPPLTPEQAAAPPIKPEAVGDAEREFAQAWADRGEAAGRRGDYQEAVRAFGVSNTARPDPAVADRASKAQAVLDARQGLKRAMEADAERKNLQAIARKRIQASLAAAMEAAKERKQAAPPPEDS